MPARNKGEGYAVSIVKAGAAIAGHSAGPVRPPLSDLRPAQVEQLAAPPIGDGDPSRAIAAALNAWPGMGISEKTDYYSTSRTSPPVSTVTPQIVLPLPQKKGPP